MENIIKVGVGVLIIDNGKVLLGHRSKTRKDTGGIYEPDTWTLPGGKQEYNETFIETGKREIKEETDLDIDDLEVYGVGESIVTDRHYITICLITNSFKGKLKVLEPTKEDEWEWFSFDNLPDNIYSPSRMFLERYRDEIRKKERK